MQFFLWQVFTKVYDGIVELASTVLAVAACIVLQYFSGFTRPKVAKITATTFSAFFEISVSVELCQFISREPGPKMKAVSVLRYQELK